MFKDPTSPEPVSRAKHAAILYDELVFEAGLFEETIGRTGASGMHFPPAMATEERRKWARVVREEGAPFQIALGAQPAPGVPAAPEDMHVFVNTEIATSYAAEWHTGVIDELQQLNPDWAGSIDSDQAVAEHNLQSTVRELKWSLERTAASEPNSFHRGFVIDSLSRDATVAAAMGAAVQVTSLFEPLLPGLPDVKPDHPGLVPLAVAVPGIDELSWEEICEFRDHAGSDEARAKLRDAEERVAADDLSDPADFALRVGQEITADLFSAMAELKGSLPKKLAKDAANAGISLLPVVGTFGSVASAGETLAESAKHSRTWHAALMKLRKATATDP